LRYVFNVAKKWGIAGTQNNPATELKTAPDVFRERLLKREEIERLLVALDVDQKSNGSLRR
jgi:hypothetical protein